MRVLILSITAGQGHHQAANAIRECLHSKNVECEILDAYKYINPILSESVARGYLLSTQLAPAFYGNFYFMAENKFKNKSGFSLGKFTQSVLGKKLVKFLADYKPDVVVGTHIFSAHIAGILQEKGFIKGKTIGIITDFTIHPFWEDTTLDYYITASELLNLQVQKKLIPLHKIKPFGIPIERKFNEKIRKKEARQKLGIADKPTVFVMSGSMGYGNVLKGIKQISKLNFDFQIVSVCGNNKLMRKKIDIFAEQASKKIYSFGYVNNVDVIMDASDCIITKPGGLTTSESLAKKLPMILMNPIPGQEDRNVDFLVNNGAAICVSRAYKVDEALYQLFSHPGRKDFLIQAMEYIRKPNSTQDLVDFIIELGLSARN